VVYVADLSGLLYAFDAQSGEPLWRYLEGDGAITGTPLVLNGAIYFATEAGSVFSVQTESGAGKRIASVEGKLYSALVAAGDLILVGVVDSDVVLIALDANGNQVWSFTPQS
jgi:outer membrane protein assembly factor BamB